MRTYRVAQNINPRQVKLNKNLCWVHVSIGRGFGILKGPLRCLFKRLDREIENVSNVIIFCVVLQYVPFELDGRLNGS